jgi:hypothetical protein
MIISLKEKERKEKQVVREQCIDKNAWNLSSVGVLRPERKKRKTRCEGTMHRYKCLEFVFSWSTQTSMSKKTKISLFTLIMIFLITL